MVHEAEQSEMAADASHTGTDGPAGSQAQLQEKEASKAQDGDCLPGSRPDDKQASDPSPPARLSDPEEANGTTPSATKEALTGAVSPTAATDAEKGSPSPQVERQVGPVLQPQKGKTPAAESSNPQAMNSAEPALILAEAAALREQLQANRRQLAVVDWSPFVSNTSKQAAEQQATLGQPEKAEQPEEELDWKHRSLPRSKRQRQRSSSSHGETTESDSEKDAAEVFVNRGQRSSSGHPLKPDYGQAPASRKRRSSPAATTAGQRKAQRSNPGKHTGKAASDKDESNAIAALEQIKNAGSEKMLATGSNSPAPPLPPPAAAAAKPDALMEAASKIPVAALQALANFMQHQGLLASHNAAGMQLSPLRGHPVSAAAAATVPELGGMRSCFSESNTENLIGKGKKELGAFRHPPDATRPSTGGTSSSLGHGRSPVALAEARAASGPLPLANLSSVRPPGPATEASAAFNLAGVSNPASTKLSSPFLLDKQIHLEPKPQGDGKRPAQVGELGAFGSIIPHIREYTKGFRSAVPREAEVQAGAKKHPAPKAQLAKGASGNLGTQSMPGLISKAGARSGFAAVSPTASCVEGAAISAASPIPVPDPRILEWVLGQRGSLTDRGKQPAAKPAQVAPPQAAFPDNDHPFPRAVSSEGASLNKKAEDESAKQTQMSTLRRPIAIRPSSVQETSPSRTRSETLLDGLLGRIQAGAAQGATGGPLEGLLESQKHPEAAPQQPFVSGDLGRVVQWAGTELALRDKKVRDAERERDEERKAHDAAMTKVGTEVSRLKCWQQELATAHWRLQESLTQKEAELKEKSKLIQQLSAGITEISQQSICAVKETHQVKGEMAALQDQHQQRDTLLLEQVESLEGALKAGSDALPLLAILKEKLQPSNDVGRVPSDRPPMPPQQ